MGLFHYLKDKNFPLDKLDFISDFDSHEGSDENIYHEKLFILRSKILPIFKKALDVLKNHGVKK